VYEQQLLAPHGRFYVVAVIENRPRDIKRVLAAQQLVGRVLARRRARNEQLMVLMFQFADAASNSSSVGGVSSNSSSGTSNNGDKPIHDTHSSASSASHSSVAH
jgi:hypothetical protein